MEGLKVHKAQATDSEFVFAVKKAAFREYVEQIWAGMIPIKGIYTIGGSLHRIFALSSFTGPTSVSCQRLTPLTRSRSINSISCLSTKEGESGQRA